MQNFHVSEPRERYDGEIEPVSAKQSNTLDGNEDLYGPNNAIDLNLDTRAWMIADSNNETWLQISLDQIYCVKRVRRLKKDGETLHTFTCNAKATNCICEGEFCQFFQLTVVIEDSSLGNLTQPTGCRYGLYGNRVKLQRINVGAIKNVYELSIVGFKGMKRHVPLKILYIMRYWYIANRLSCI